MAEAAVLDRTVPPEAFRRALGRFATGVTLVTARGGHGLVVNAFMSVSLEPPLVAFGAGALRRRVGDVRRTPV